MPRDRGAQVPLEGLSRLERRPRVSTTIQDVIKAYITDHGLHPGSPLPSETELADHLGVSRNSVREAVKALQALGLVEARIRAGLFVGFVPMNSVIEALVSGLSGEQEIFEQALDARCAIEAGMATAVCSHCDSSQLRELRRIITDWSKEVAAGRYSAVCDAAFHRCLSSRAGNHLVTRLLDTLWELRNRALMRGVAREPPDVVEVYERHRHMLRALEAGDPEALREAVEAHYIGAHNERHVAPLATNVPLSDPRLTAESDNRARTRRRSR